MPTVAELKESAKKKGIQGYFTMKKAQLEKALGVSPSKKSTVAKKVAKMKTAKSKTSTRAKSKKPFAWIILAYVKGRNEPEIDVFAKREDAILHVLARIYETASSSLDFSATLIRRDGYVVSDKWTYLVESDSELPGGKATNLKLIKIIKDALTKA